MTHSTNQGLGRQSALTRRSFVAGASVLAAGMLLGGPFGCSAPAEEGAADTSIEAEAAATGKAADLVFKNGHVQTLVNEGDVAPGRRRARRRHRVRRRRCRHRGVRRRRDQGHRPRRQVLVPGLHGRPPARPTALLRRTVPNRHPRRHHGQRGVSAHHPRVRGSASRRRSVLRRTVHAERLSATRRIEPGPAERGPRRHLLRQAHHDPRRIAPFLLGEQQGAGNRRNHGRHADPTEAPSCTTPLASQAVC